MLQLQSNIINGHVQICNGQLRLKGNAAVLVTAAGYRPVPSRRTAIAAAAASPPAATTTPAAPTELVKLPPEIVAAGGLDPTKDSPDNVRAFQEMLGTAFVPVNLQHPGVRVQNIDPPVLTCDNFLPAEVCDALIAAAKASGQMKASRSSNKDIADIRTSSTLAITKDVLAACPALRQPLQQLLDAALQLVGHGLDTSAISAMQFQPPTSHTQLCPELPQIAHYLPGQHFLAHEDGFPSEEALQKGRNRRATLLVYLNDVPQGGATKFDLLELGVQPQRGKALLFFPAFSGGKPDGRTVHTAEDAAEGCEKWVFQLWLTSGLPRRPPINAAAAAAQQMAEERRGSNSAAKKQKRPNKKKR